jgi:hypothetical protein
VQVGQPIPYGTSEPDEGRRFPPRRQACSVAIATPSISETSFSLSRRTTPTHNARFALPATEPGSAFVADRNAAFVAILCIQEERVVGNDNTVRYRGLSLQLPESPLASPLRQGQGPRP